MDIVRVPFWGVDPLLLPPNVDPRLFTPEMLGAVSQDAWLRLVSVDGVALHVALEFQHRGRTVVGPVFISVLHALVLGVPPPSPEERQAVMAHHLGEYLRTVSELTVIAVPPRASGSPTQRVFSALASGVRRLGDHDHYFFHGDVPDEGELLERLRALRDAWSANAAGLTPLQEYAAIRDPEAARADCRRLFEAVAWLRDQNCQTPLPCSTQLERN